MSIKTRTRGDDYPIIATFRVNGEAIDLSGAVVKFSYSNEDNEAKTIVGVVEGGVGEATFTPESGVDFMFSGTFIYDLQRVSDGFTYTHEKATLLIDDDVTK